MTPELSRKKGEKVDSSLLPSLKLGKKKALLSQTLTAHFDEITIQSGELSTRLSFCAERSTSLKLPL